MRFDSSDWLRGLVPQSIDVVASLTYGDGLSSAGSIDPYRAPGAIFPWFDTSSYTNGSTVDNLPVASERYGIKQYILAEASAGTVDLHEVDTGSVTAAGNFPHEIVSGTAGKVGGDVVMYNFNGTPYLLYSYNSSTAGDLGYYDFSSTFDDDYFTTTLSQTLNKDYPHPLFVSPRTGICYVGDKDKLKYIDGRGLAIGSADKGTTVLSISEEFVITGFAAHPNYMVIFAYSRRVSAGSTTQPTYKGRPVAMFWDEATAKPHYIVDLPGNFVGGGFTYKGFPATFSNDATKGYLSLVDTASYQVLTQIDTTSSMTNGGVQVVDDDIYINLGGTVYRYGSTMLGGDQLLIPVASVTSGAMFRYNLNGYTTYNGSALIRFSGGYRQGATFQTAFKQLPPSFDSGYKIKAMKVYWANTISGQVGLSALQIRTDNATKVVNLISSDTNTISDLTTTYDVDSSGNELPLAARNISVAATWSSTGTTDGAIGIEAIELLLETETLPS